MSLGHLEFEHREPLARRSDPDTSHEAGAELTASGRRATAKALVLQALRMLGGEWTSAELAEKAGLDRYMVARRLPDLYRDDWVVRGAARICRVSGLRALTWRYNRAREEEQG